MNKQITFRAWCVYRGKGSYITFDLKDAGTFDWGIFDKPPIFEQFTGLKDSKGREVYEGDIIQYKIPWNGETVVRLVKYDKNFLSFVVGDVDGTFVQLCEVLDMEKIRVMGNIYENPELLESLSAK